MKGILRDRRVKEQVTRLLVALLGLTIYVVEQLGRS